MRITIKLFASYRVGRFKEAAKEYPARASVGEVLTLLELAGARGLVLVNGRPAVPGQELREGDTMTLVPLISGG